MYKMIWRLLTQPVYIRPHAHGPNEVPDCLTLREVLDMPPHHPRADAAKAGSPCGDGVSRKQHGRD